MLDHSRFEQEPQSWSDIYKSYMKFSESGKQWIFRGQESSGWRLRSTLERAIVKYGLGTKDFPNPCKKDYLRENLLYQGILKQGLQGRDQHDAYNIELALLRKFKRQCFLYTSQPPEDENIMEWLALMRHYLAPTRLIDWTYSFFVALFFAIENASSNAAIWALDTDWLQEQVGKYFPDERDIFDRDQHIKKETFKELFTQDKAKAIVYAVNPYRRNERLSIQQGIFLCPGRIDIPFEDNLVGLLSKQNARKYFKKLSINLNCTTRNEILRHLSGMNVSRAALFPGLEGFARSIETNLAFPNSLVSEPL